MALKSGEGEAKTIKFVKVRMEEELAGVSGKGPGGAVMSERSTRSRASGEETRSSWGTRRVRGRWHLNGVLEELPRWSRGQDSALPVQEGLGLIPGWGIRSHISCNED